MKLENKVAVVYGAAKSTGIGKSYCEALLQKGTKVCFCDVLNDEGRKLEADLQAKYGADHVCFMICDVTCDTQVEDTYLYAVKAYGNVDIVVANAGIINENNWKLVLDINLGGVIRAFHTAKKYMGLDQGGKGGAFVATCSTSGIYTTEFLPSYTASKHGLVGYLRSWSGKENFIQHGIRINTICPTDVDTEMLKQYSPERLLTEAHRKQAGRHLKYKTTEKILKPEEIASALIRLLEDDKLSGQFLIINPNQTDEFATFMERS